MNIGIYNYSYYIFSRDPKLSKPQVAENHRACKCISKARYRTSTSIKRILSSNQVVKMVTKAYKGDIGILSAWVRKKGMAQPEDVFLFPFQWPELPSLSTVGIQGLSTVGIRGQSIPSCNTLGSTNQMRLVLPQV